jgi:hypothetical protein
MAYQHAVFTLDTKSPTKGGSHEVSEDHPNRGLCMVGRHDFDRNA